MTDEDWRVRHRLFHYTRSVADVVSILNHGLLLFPNRRDLIQRFLPKDDFSPREPQQFGMTSFTELPVEQARSHREKFGNFGICIGWDWAVRNDAQRVIYLDDFGIVFETFKWLFELGRQGVGAGPFGTFAIGNKEMAGIEGARLYRAMLTLYEYMETSRNSSQVEWRIVNKIPILHNISDRTKLLAEMIERSHVSTMETVVLEANDVEMLICPQGQRKALRSALPSAFESVPIFSYTSSSSFSSAVGTAIQWLAELRRRRDR